MVGKNINNVDKTLLRIVRKPLFTLYFHAWQKVFNLWSVMKEQNVFLKKQKYKWMRHK